MSVGLSLDDDGLAKDGGGEAAESGRGWDEEPRRAEDERPPENGVGEGHRAIV